MDCEWIEMDCEWIKMDREWIEMDCKWIEMNCGCIEIVCDSLSFTFYIDLLDFLDLLLFVWSSAHQVLCSKWVS